MPRNVSADFKTILASEDMVLATCIRIKKADGTKIGFTTNNVAFTYTFITNTDGEGATDYTPIASFDPSSIASSSDYSVDNLELIGVIDSSYITEQDIEANFYQGCEVVIFKVCPENLAAGEMIEKIGTIGNITLKEGRYVFELLSRSSYLKRNIGRITSPTCTIKKFCNALCKLTEASYTHAGHISSAWVFGSTQFDISFTSYTPTVGNFVNGLIRISRTIVYEREIKKITDNGDGTYRAVVREGFPFALSADAISIVEGCDRTFATCSGSRMNNAVNFRGEPHLPGNDQILETGRSV